MEGSRVKRYAIVYGARDVDQVAALLPDNYKVVGSFYTPLESKFAVEIEGTDKAGWTLNDYVIPRLSGGLLTVKEEPPGV
jgi:hypothetical protein